MKKKTKESKINKKFATAFIALILTISFFTVFGEKGLMDVFDIRKNRDKIKDHNIYLEEENKILVKEIELLKTDDKYIALTVKKELGMIEKNEVIYRLEAGDNNVK